MESYLNVNSISCGYPEFMLNDVSFTVKKGDFAGIIGPNGSGKTTLFNGLTGILKKQHGSIVLGGRDLGEMSPKEKAQHIAVVSQFTEKVELSVQEYVLMGRFPYHGMFQFYDSKADLAIANKYMALTGVDKYKNKLMTQLSGGEQQLAAVARALTQEPSLLLLDEPTAHLDITHQVQLLNLVQRLNSELGLTVLMIIHDLNLAGEYCDKLIMINKGTLHISGTPEEVLTYKNIEDVYKTVVITQKNPLSQKTAIFLVSDKVIQENKNS